MPYGSGRNACFPVCHPSLHITSSELSVNTLFAFYSEVPGTSFELFSRMSFEMAPSRVWDVPTPLCWVPPPTGTVWSSLLFRLHPAKHSAALHFIQKPMYSQKEIMSKYFLCNCFIQSKFKNLTYFPLKMGLKKFCN